MTEPFKNQHLSYSRLSRFETCPLSYRLHYVEKKQSEPGLPLRFGKLLHAVLEQLLREVVEDERFGPLSEARTLEIYRDAWSAEKLAGVDVFSEGLRILREFLRVTGVVDHRNILGVEKAFRLAVGPFEVVGSIDRVDWVDDETIEVIDYKSNHQLFARDEVDTSLQLSLYHVAAQQLWPWVKKVKLSFWMLRHGLRQETSRTEEQLVDALAYVETLGRQTESTTEFPARLNANCSYCDHRKNCAAYAEALQGKREFICEDLADLAAVATEREEVARLAKALYARKEELDDILKAQLHNREELVLAGTRYKMLASASAEYPLEPTVSLLADATSMSREEVLRKIGAIDKKALDNLLRSASKKLEKPQVALLKATLEAHASRKVSPRLWAKEVA